MLFGSVTSKLVVWYMNSDELNVTHICQFTITQVITVGLHVIDQWSSHFVYVIQLSADSGQGGSIKETCSPVTVPGTATSLGRVTFEFDFPSEYCGRLIGRNGRNINELKAKAGGVEVLIKRKMYTQDVQVVCLEGRSAYIIYMTCIYCIVDLWFKTPHVIRELIIMVVKHVKGGES